MTKIVDKIAKELGYIPNSEQRKYFVPVTGNYAVENINPDDDSMGEALGIPLERRNVLEAALEKRIKEALAAPRETYYCENCKENHERAVGHDIVAQIADLSKDFAHQNELAYVCLIYHKLNHKIQLKGAALSSIEKLRNLFEGGFKP